MQARNEVLEAKARGACCVVLRLGEETPEGLDIFLKVLLPKPLGSLPVDLMALFS